MAVGRHKGHLLEVWRRRGQVGSRRQVPFRGWPPQGAVGRATLTRRRPAIRRAPATARRWGGELASSWVLHGNWFLFVRAWAAKDGFWTVPPKFSQKFCLPGEDDFPYSSARNDIFENRVSLFVSDPSPWPKRNGGSQAKMSNGGGKKGEDSYRTAVPSVSENQTDR